MILIVLAVTISRGARAQSPPPVQGTMALEGTMQKFYRAANVVMVTTIDGVEHAYHFTKDLVVHGGKSPNVSALDGMQKGTTVVVHYTVDGTKQTVQEVDIIGDQGLDVTEGTVTRIDRGRGQITVRYDNGKTDLFQLTQHAAAETSQSAYGEVPDGTKIVIYYSDDHGQKVAHFFKRVAK
jgi:hypothetical protein